MPYTRGRTWPDTDRDDYVIRCDGHDVGRVYKTRVPEGDRWQRSIYIIGSITRVPGVPISGLAPDLDAAATAFKLAYERMRSNAGLPKPHPR